MKTTPSTCLWVARANRPGEDGLRQCRPEAAIHPDEARHRIFLTAAGTCRAPQAPGIVLPTAKAGNFYFIYILLFDFIMFFYLFEYNLQK